MSPKSNNPAPFGNLELPAQFWYSAIGGMDTNGSPTICGMSAAVAASDTLTFVANAHDDDTFTIGSIAYRVKSTMAQAYDVKLGGTAAITLDNIKAAVNASGTFGTEYYAGTLPHPEVTATTNTSTTQLFVAKNAGAYGNRIVATETFTDAGNVFSSATFAGGTNSALKVDATISATAESTAEATAAAPSYTEGQDAPLSQDLNGNLRVKETGATTLATSQVATSGTAGTLAIARATRRSILVRNLDAAISVYVGPATVTTANGMLLKAGESCEFTFTGLLQVIAASGTPTVAIADEYD